MAQNFSYGFFAGNKSPYVPEEVVFYNRNSDGYTGLNNKFSPQKVNQLLPVTSPNMVAMLNTIERLDIADLTGPDQTLYKHFIYSEMDEKMGNFGSNLVISALLARGYTNMFDEQMKTIRDPLHADANKARKTFVFLSATTPFKQKFDREVRRGVKFKDVVRDTFNKKENAFGQHVRFIVLSKNFREGLDLFDVRYGHLLEPMTKSQEIQAMGRGTRRCGQRNLRFKGGWDLFVYRYLLDNSDALAKAYNWPVHFEDMLEKLRPTDKIGDLFAVFQDIARLSSIDRARDILDPYVEETSEDGKQLLKEQEEENLRIQKRNEELKLLAKTKQEELLNQRKLLEAPPKSLEELIKERNMQSKDQKMEQVAPRGKTPVEPKGKTPVEPKGKSPLRSKEKTPLSEQDDDTVLQKPFFR